MLGWFNNCTTSFFHCSNWYFHCSAPSIALFNNNYTKIIQTLALWDLRRKEEEKKHRDTQRETENRGKEWNTPENVAEKQLKQRRILESPKNNDSFLFSARKVVLVCSCYTTQCSGVNCKSFYFVREKYNEKKKKGIRNLKKTRSRERNRPALGHLQQPSILPLHLYL